MANNNSQERSSFNIDIAQRVKMSREKLGLSQRALAEKAGLRQQQISSLETGERLLTAYGMVKLAKALCTTTDYLFTGETEQWESELLKRFSSLSDFQKDAVKTILDQTFLIIQEANSKE